jgi:hypothetical protein
VKQEELLALFVMLALGYVRVFELRVVCLLQIFRIELSFLVVVRGLMVSL